MDLADIIIAHINEEIKPLEEAVTSGRPDSLDEYKRLCGEIRGMLIARDIVATIKHEMETFDDE